MAKRMSMRAVLESAYQLGIKDFKDEGFTAEDLRRGMEVEREHDKGKLDVTNGYDDICRIALAHLRETPNYYRKLIPAEKEWKADAKARGLTKSVRGEFCTIADIPLIITEVTDIQVNKSVANNQITRLYHGTSASFDQFDQSKANLGEVIWFTPKHNYARHYANRYGKGRVIAADVKMNNTLDVGNNPEHRRIWLDHKNYEDRIPRLRALGYDSMKTMNGDEIGVFHHDQINIIDHDFKPTRQSKLSKSLTEKNNMNYPGPFKSQKTAWGADRHPLTLQKGKTLVKQHLRHEPDGSVTVVHEHWTSVSKADKEAGKKSKLVQRREVNIPDFDRELAPSELPSHSQNRSKNYVHFTIKGQNPNHLGYYVMAEGRPGYHQTDEFHAENERKKFNRAEHMANNIEDIMDMTKSLVAAPFGSLEHAVGTIISLIDRHCFRIGGDESREANEHFGVTTLERRHVIDQPDGTVRLAFTGKSGHDWDRTIGNGEADTLKRLRDMSESDNDMVWKYVKGGKLVRVTQDDIRGFLARWNLHPKDFRTYHACRLTFTNLRELGAKTDLDLSDPKGRAKLVDQAIKLTAEHLNHEPGVCKKNYISSEVYSDFLETGKLPGSSRFAPDLKKSLADSLTGKWLPGEREFVDWIIARKRGKVTSASSTGKDTGVTLQKSLGTFVIAEDGGIDITFGGI